MTSSRSRQALGAGTGRADRHEALLRSYVAPEVVAHIMSDGRAPLPSGIRVPIVVLFADIRGFTRLAERLAAESVVALLDEYFDEMSAAALRHGAIIDKLIGDAVMLLYGLPSVQGDEAMRAVATALEMQARFRRLLLPWRSRLPPRRRLGLGVGCAGGEVVLANVGSAARMDYTVIGAAVNLAARLAAHAPLGVTLIDEAVRRELPTGRAGSVRIGRARRLALKGIGHRVPAFACASQADAPPPRARLLIDPVCGMKVHASRAVVRTISGRRVYFCSGACAKAFADDPRRFKPRAGTVRRPRRARER
jgi:class 3 adenylate cyclase